MFIIMLVELPGYITLIDVVRFLLLLLKFHM